MLLPDPYKTFWSYYKKINCTKIEVFRIRSHLLKKSLMKHFIFCAVIRNGVWNVLLLTPLKVMQKKKNLSCSEKSWEKSVTLIFKFLSLCFSGVFTLLLTSSCFIMTFDRLSRVPLSVRGTVLLKSTCPCNVWGALLTTGLKSGSFGKDFSVSSFLSTTDTPTTAVSVSPTSLFFIKGNKPSTVADVFSKSTVHSLSRETMAFPSTKLDEQSNI